MNDRKWGFLRETKELAQKAGRQFSGNMSARLV